MSEAREDAITERERRERDMEEKRQKKLDARAEAALAATVKKVQMVPAKISKPKLRNLDRKKPLEYIVWSSNEDDNDVYNNGEDDTQDKVAYGFRIY
jgi:hypothetical protein